MPSSLMPTIMQPLSMDDGFLSVLQQSHDWHIHSVFNNTLNLSAPKLPLLTLSNQKQDSLPLCIMTQGIDFSHLKPHIGLAVSHTTDMLSLGNQYRINLINTPQRSHYLKASCLSETQQKQLSQAAQTLHQTLIQSATIGSFFTSFDRPLFEQGLSQFLRQQANRLNHAIQQPHLNNIETATLGLLGLGIGLTPSGDDYLVGLLAGLRLTSPEAQSTQILSNSISQHAAQKTNDISTQYLLCATTHHYKSSLLALIQSLENNQPLAAKQHLSQLLQTGSTSGTDIACGLIASLLPHCFEKDAL